jgi:ribose 1,5-bisphosphokinase
MSGRVFAIVGPSGAGKDTLIAGALAAEPALHWARRVITRDPGAGGEPFEGVSEAEFARRLAAGEFALQWQAHGLRYGVPKQEVPAGRDVLVNLSRGVLAEAARVFPGLRVIAINAPAEVLAERLAARGRETAGDIAQRLRRAEQALPEGITAQQVCNDAAPEVGVARLLQALRG